MSSIRTRWNRFIVLVGVCLFWLPTQLQAQTSSVRGFVTDASDGQPLQGVNIALRDVSGSLRGSVADDDGFFIVVRLQPGQWFLQASFIGYETYADTLHLSDEQTLRLNISLHPGVEMEALVVEGAREGGAMVSAGVQTVRPADVDLVPTADVSGDLVSYLSAMPGVVSIGDRGGQVFIRGGEPSQNLSLLDGMYIYQPFHILGFYSAFSSDILRNADIHAGAFSSKYSGRMSSVIDVHTRNGNLQQSRRTFSLAPFMSAGILEGPVSRGRMSYLFSARASTIERVASSYIDQPVPYSFGDFFGKIHWIINDSHQLSMSAIHTYDRGALNTIRQDSTEIRWKNTAYGGRWLVAPPNLPMLGEVLFSVSTLNMERGGRDNPDRSSAIDGFNLAVNLTNYGQRTNVDWGFYLRAPRLDASLGGLFQNLDFTSDRILSTGAYFEPEITITSTLKARVGLSAQYLGDQGFHMEPRVRLFYDSGTHQLSIAGGLYSQEMVGLNDRRDATNIFTAWVGSPGGSLPNSLHGLIGYRSSILPGVNLSVELFYKKYSDLSVSEWTAFPRFSTRLQDASGRAMGADLRLELRRRDFYGFINYGLSSVEYKAMQESIPIWFDSNELAYSPPHDRRHQINVLVSFTWKQFDYSARWNFGSGLPYSQIRGFDGFILLDGAVDVTKDPGTSRIIYDRPYNGVLPHYHRLDISIDRVFQYGDDSFITIQAGVINIYNQSNLFSLDTFTAERNDQLPLIPTAGLKFEF
ncbi:MAG: TonB-dependent receptor [Bacteroidetes bacterium]|nr:TonB-dependent receptor [Bacteroidota bacterium]